MTTPDYPTKILEIINFFDIFDRPLTAWEVWQYLGAESSWAAVQASLGEQAAGGRLAEKDGLYFFPGREGIITIRRQRFNYTNQKLKIARLFSFWLRLWPFVKLIAVSNSIGDRNLRRESDIDFFIIASPGRLWLTRFLAAGLAKLVNRRPTVNKKQDRLCLSFYLNAAQLNLDSLKLLGGDPYFEYWRRGLMVVYDRGGWEERFLAANSLKAGVGQMSAAASARTGADYSGNSSNIESHIKKQTPVSFLFNFLEAVLRRWQLKIMPPALKMAVNNSAGVVINDQVLKFYQHDRRAEFRDKFSQKINGSSC
jgi:hypothetical protein